MMLRMGGGCVSITRTCTDDVCVRKAYCSFKFFDSTKKVSCISRAGCSGGKFSAEKLCQSSSISGPSVMLNPMRSNICTMRFRIIEIGCSDPKEICSPGNVKSTSLTTDDLLSNESL